MGVIKAIFENVAYLVVYTVQGTYLNIHYTSCGLMYKDKTERKCSESARHGGMDNSQLAVRNGFLMVF
jgi:hypothetical protein